MLSDISIYSFFIKRIIFNKPVGIIFYEIAKTPFSLIPCEKRDFRMIAKTSFEMPTTNLKDRRFIINLCRDALNLNFNIIRKILLSAFLFVWEGRYIQANNKTFIINIKLIRSSLAKVSCHLYSWPNSARQTYC